MNKQELIQRLRELYKAEMVVLSELDQPKIPFKAWAKERMQSLEQANESASVRITKAMIARRIFSEEHVKGSTRSEILRRFRDEAKLTERGALTYYQTIKHAVELQ